MEADLYELKLCRFLCPLNCATKFSGAPSSNREMLVFRTEWLAILSSTSLQTGLLSCFTQKLTDLIFTEWRQFVPAIWFLKPIFVVYGKETWIIRTFGLLRTMALLKLKMADRASFCSRCEYFWVKLSLVRTFHGLPGLAPSFCHPNQNIFACFRVGLKLQITPSTLPWNDENLHHEGY